MRALIPLAVALLVSAPIVFQPGFPAYQHDWSWPFTRAAAWFGVLGQFSSWDSSGLGRANALATSNPLAYLLTILPAVIDPLIAGKVLFALVIAIAGYGAVAASRALKAGNWPSIIAGIGYMTSAALVNKIGAGHIGFWWSYALAPFLFAASHRYCLRPNVQRALLLALLCAVITIQIQFALFGLIIALCASGKAPLRHILQVVGLWLTGIIVALTPTFFSFWSSSHLLREEYPAPKLVWEQAMGTGLPSALWLTHYSPAYVESHFAQWIPIFIASACVCVVSVACVLLLYGAIGRQLALLVLVGLAFATGADGPMGGLWRFAYSHITVSTVFREGAHANAMISLGYALALALAATRFRIIFAAGSITVICAAVPWISGGLRQVAPNVLPPTMPTHSSNADARVAFFPLASPISFDGKQPGGVDVFAASTISQPSLAEYPPLPPTGIYSVTRCACEPSFANAMHAAGVSEAIGRSEFSSVDLDRQNYRGPKWPFTVRFPYNGIVAFAHRADELPLSLAKRSEGAGISSASGPLPNSSGHPATRAIQPAWDAADNPGTAWAAMNRWYATAEPFAPTIEEGVVTTASNAELDLVVPPGHWSVLHANVRPLAAVCSHPLILPATTTLRWDALPSGSCRIVSRGGASILVRLATGTAKVPSGTFPAPRVLTLERKIPWELAFDTNSAPSKPVLLLFRERYDAGWSVDGAKVLWHGMVDGYGNAFLILMHRRHLEIVYRPQFVLTLLIAASWLAYTLMGTFIIFAEVRQHEHWFRTAIRA